MSHQSDRDNIRICQTDQDLSQTTAQFPTSLDTQKNPGVLDTEARKLLPVREDGAGIAPTPQIVTYQEGGDKGTLNGAESAIPYHGDRHDDSHHIAGTGKGFLKFPRELHLDPKWNAKGMSVLRKGIFLELLLHVVWKPTEFYDGHHLILLQPGQYCLALRPFAKSIGCSLQNLRSALDFFCVLNLSTHKSTHERTVVTITYPPFCEYLKHQPNTRLNIEPTQTQHTKEEFKTKKNKKKESQRTAPVATEDGMRLAVLFASQIKKADPGFRRPDIHRWGKAIDDIARLDGRSYQAIEDIIRWLPTDDFWPTVVLSPGKLRKQFTQLLLAKQGRKAAKAITPMDKAKALVDAILPRCRAGHWVSANDEGIEYLHASQRGAIPASDPELLTKLQTLLTQMELTHD